MQGKCSYRCGTLPACAPLALAYVPKQSRSEPAYNSSDALKRGTLFPGLDLPFMNIVNTAEIDPGDTPLSELMKLSFAAHELHLYLDTHPEDKEAFQTLRRFLKLQAEAKRRYVKKYGPLCPEDLADSETFDWLDEPWPWAYQD